MIENIERFLYIISKAKNYKKRINRQKVLELDFNTNNSKKYKVEAI